MGSRASSTSTNYNRSTHGKVTWIYSGLSRTRSVLLLEYTCVGTHSSLLAVHQLRNLRKMISKMVQLGNSAASTTKYS
jgi:hypothetical protein